MGSNIARIFRDAGAEQDLKLGEHEVDMKWPYIVLIFINMLIILPICIYMTYNYFILRHSYMYNKRRPGLVIIFNIVAIVFIGIYTPIHIIIMEIYWQNNAKYEEWWDSAFFFTTQICVFVSFALRVWHSFYDFKLEHSVSNIEWKSIINENYRNQKQSFFLKYKKSLGKPQKTFLYFLIIPATVFGIIFISIISNRVGYETEYLMLCISFLYLVAAVILLIYIIRQTWREVFDNIHLRGEILWGCIVLCITVSLEAIIFGIDLIEYSVENEKYQQVFNFCFNIVTCLSCFALIIVSTQYVRIKVAQQEKQIIEAIQQKTKQTNNDEKLNEIAMQIQDENRWIFQDEVDFQALISTPDGLLAFFSYLAKEYQLNYLVFAMEVTQYKEYVIPLLLRKHKQFVQELESSIIEFPTTMPESTIIFPIEGHTTERRMFMHLYEKYIDQKSEWPIKISNEIFNEIVSVYRRCQMARTRDFSIYNSKNYDDDGNPIMSKASSIHSTRSDTPNSPISTMRNNPLTYTIEMQTSNSKSKTSTTRNWSDSQSHSTVIKAKVMIKDLKAMVEALDGALNDVIVTLKKSFAKYRETEAFGTWFAHLTASNRDIMTQKWRVRMIVQETVVQKENMTDCKTWACKHCSLVNRAIHVDNRVRVPKSICMCCGHKNTETNVLLRTATSMPHTFRHLSTHSRVSSIFAADKQRRSTMRKSARGLVELANHESIHSVDSFNTSFKDDELHEIISPMDTFHGNYNINNGLPQVLMDVHLDENIVSEWEKMLIEINTNKEDNTCEGADSEYIDSCPQIQQLFFVMKCYNYYLGKQCKCDEIKYKKNPNLQKINYNIVSMAELVNHLEGLNLQKLLDMYQHVSTIHFEPDMFDFFEDTLGKCKGGRHCKPLSRNNGRRGGYNMNNDDINDTNNRNRNRTNNDIDEDKKEEEKYTPFRPLRRVATVSNAISYKDSNGKRVTSEERITLSYLDKWHSFLFHPNVKQKQNIVIDKDDDDDDDEEEDDEDEVIQSSDTVMSLGNNSNKFVTDASNYGSLSKVVSTKMNLLKNNNKGKSYDDIDDIEHKNNIDDVINEDELDEETYYAYIFGQQIEYHTLSPHFVCMKQELIGNDIHTITENIWDDTLAKALLCLEMESVHLKYVANDHGNHKKYGVKKGELIGIDNVIAILFYCNFDDLQNIFSKTFRKMESDDTTQSIIERHCKNFYWLGRALYVAINFYGQRMQPNQVVWHGLSSKMLFDDFAAYFDCPTSTTTQKNVAQTFSGNGNGIILKLKSKHNNNCAWMLDVSLFSDFTDECERLFLNETLIITDILTIINNRWISFKKYIGACLYFNKITTGNANDYTWNIKETELIQNTLAKIIIDYLMNANNLNGNDNTQKIPDYVGVLFKHYCQKHDRPRFDDIDKIQYKIHRTLQQYLFDFTINEKTQIKNDKKQKISQPKIKLLFPNATHYINDQKEVIQFINYDDNNDQPIINQQKSLSLGKRKKSKA